MAALAGVALLPVRLCHQLGAAQASVAFKRALQWVRRCSTWRQTITTFSREARSRGRAGRTFHCCHME